MRWDSKKDEHFEDFYFVNPQVLALIAHGMSSLNFNCYNLYKMIEKYFSEKAVENINLKSLAVLLYSKTILNKTL